MTEEHQLEEIKQRVDKLKTAKIRAQERLDTALQELKKNYGFKDISEAQTAFDRIQKEIPLLEAKLEKLVNQVETKLTSIERAIN